MSGRAVRSAVAKVPDFERNLSDLAYERLSQMILHKKLPGGTFVVEGKLAEQLNISRTPMREAILRLAAEGLLVKQGSRSYAVRQVQPVEFFQSLKVRELLECEAIELAAGKVRRERIEELRRGILRVSRSSTQEAAHWEMDDGLHLMFADASGNAVLARLIRQVRVCTRLFEIISPFGRVQADADEHLEILDAFARGDIRVARRAMVKHLRNVASEALDIVGGR